MAKMMDARPTKYEGEAKTWDCIKDNLWDEVICYYNRQVNNREFDFCLLIEDIGLVIIEVKGWTPGHIKKVESPDKIYLSNGTVSTSPKKQARGYSFALRNILNEKYGINPDVMEMVCYPFISESDYIRLGLNVVSEAEYTLFREDILSSQNFNAKIYNVYINTNYSAYDVMRNDVYNICRKHFEPTYEIQPPKPKMVPYSVLTVLTEPLTLSKVEEIIDSYFHGTKQIIFTAYEEDLCLLVKYLSNMLNKKGICIDGVNLSIGNSSENTVEIANKKISIFNFEAIYLPNYTITESLVLENGITTDEQKAVLLDLSKCSSFNLNQYMVEHADVNSNIQVKAGAGTGKTYSMVSRIAFLCHASSNSGVLDVANEIAMLTFTSDAATNMKVRLKKLFVNYFILTSNTKYLDLVSGIEKMRISTIHSFAKEIISLTSSVLGIGTNFMTVVGQYERQKIFDKVFDEYLQGKNQEEPMFFENLPFDLYDLKKYFLSFAKLLYDKGCDIKAVPIESFSEPIEAIPYINEIFEKVIIRAEKEFTKFMFDNNSIHMSEYMIYMSKCIADKSFNKNLFAFKYVFIDEFQDTDDAQISAFIEMQKKLGFLFFIVGDLKQSIYRFRGATMDAFKKMGCGNGNWLSFSLNTNYRSDSRLLEQYDRLFSALGKVNHLPYDDIIDRLKGIKVNTDYEDGVQVQRVPYTGEDLKNNTYFDMLFRIVSEQKNKLEELLKKKKAKGKALSLPERTIAILTRKNYEIDNILNAAKKRLSNGEINFEIQSDSSGDLYSMDCAIDLCKLTSALSNPYAPSYLYDLIQSNNVNVEFSLSSILGKSKEEKVRILTDCLNQYFKEVLNLDWESLIYEVQNQPILKNLRIIYEATKPWKSFSSDKLKQEHYRTNYELVFEELSARNKRTYLTLDSVNESLHIAITAGMETKSREINSDDDGIRIICTTVHKSKGLEYGTVILPYTNSAINVPHKNTIDVTCIDGKIGYCFSGEDAQYCNEYYSLDAELEETTMEETRILYVAMTRAINNFLWFYQTDSKTYNWSSLLKDL